MTAAISAQGFIKEQQTESNKRMILIDCVCIGKTKTKEAKGAMHQAPTEPVYAGVAHSDLWAQDDDKNKDNYVGYISSPTDIRP